MRPSSTDEVLRMRADLFTDSSVPVVRQDETLKVLLEKLTLHHDHTVIVVDENNVLQGIVSDQDVIAALTDPSKAIKAKDNELTAWDIMTHLTPDGKTVVFSTDTVGDAIEILRGENVLKKPLKVVPVIRSDGKVLGQVTRNSIQTRLDDLLEE